MLARRLCKLAGRAMTYWLGMDNPEVWEASRRKYDLSNRHPFGFPTGRRKSVQKMKIGDRIANYITQPHSCFFAVWEITNGYHIIEDNVLAGTLFPECVEVQPLIIRSPEKGIKNNWVISVRMSAVRLKDDVGEEILTALQRD
jgi:hypothetical protein